MTTQTASCESCGMPIESGRYCQYCTDADGILQDFDTRFAAMVGWQSRRHPDQSHEAIEEQTRAYMSSLPAWRGHPRLADRTLDDC
ncbi:zinc ribbon domain-containing protein [Micropruina sp.]|uniref:zinc ribbon domain-containing protein n=1 Tax=Micropruina sp. TaxID=2737536 RepID=UPI0039E3E3EF